MQHFDINILGKNTIWMYGNRVVGAEPFLKNVLALANEWALDSILESIGLVFTWFVCCFEGGKLICHLIHK